jgi:hypothetical protein
MAELHYESPALTAELPDRLAAGWCGTAHPAAELFIVVDDANRERAGRGKASFDR